MNRLAVLQGIASKMPVPGFCEAHAKRSASDSLEFVIAYKRDGRKYFCVTCFLDEWPDAEFKRQLFTIQALVPRMRDAIKRGLPE